MRTSESKDTRTLDNSSATFEPEVRDRARGMGRANLGFGALDEPQPFGKREQPGEARNGERNANGCA